MDKNFIKEMNFRRTIKYKKPCIITMSGLPGSGKTPLAQALSRKLGIYLLSTDYVRNYLFVQANNCSDEERIRIQAIVKRTNFMRLNKLLLHHVSFVFDKDLNTKHQFIKFILLSKLLKYELIKIRINSNDDNNIDRINKRVFDLEKIDDSIIGDNVSYSSPYPESVYYEIKQRKPQDLDGVAFDYTIDNNGTMEDFNESIEKVINDIEKTKLKQVIR
jgi:adenylate kinase family enzyme